MIADLILRRARMRPSPSVILRRGAHAPVSKDEIERGMAEMSEKFRASGADYPKEILSRLETMALPPAVPMTLAR
jgi:hypothetical protein